MKMTSKSWFWAQIPPMEITIICQTWKQPLGPRYLKTGSISYDLLILTRRFWKSARRSIRTLVLLHTAELGEHYCTQYTLCTLLLSVHINEKNKQNKKKKPHTHHRTRLHEIHTVIAFDRLACRRQLPLHLRSFQKCRELLHRISAFGHSTALNFLACQFAALTVAYGWTRQVGALTVAHGYYSTVWRVNCCTLLQFGTSVVAPLNCLAR